MTRKTSFYYSFLVLPAPQREAITAVFDFCRAVDDSVDLEPDAGLSRSALDDWRDEVARVLRRRPARDGPGPQLQPFVGPFHLPREQFDALVDGVAMDITPRRYANVRGARAVLPSRRVVGRTDLRRDFRCPRSIGARLCARPRRRAAAHEHPARRRRGLPARPLLSAAGGSGAVRLHRGRHARAAGRRTPGLTDERLRALLDHQAARARIFSRARPARCPKETPRDLSPPRSCAPSTGICCAASRPIDSTCFLSSSACRSPLRRGSR